MRQSVDALGIDSTGLRIADRLMGKSPCLLPETVYACFRMAVGQGPVEKMARSKGLNDARPRT